MMISHRLHLPGTSRSRFIFWVTVLVLLNICWVIFAVTAYFERLDRYQRLTSEGRTVFATITGLENWTDSNLLSTYRVHYQFFADINSQRTLVSAQQDISHQLFSSLKVGQTVEVIYDTSDPNISSIEAANELPSVLTPVIFIVGALVCSAILIYFDYRFRFRTSKENRIKIGYS